MLWSWLHQWFSVSLWIAVIEFGGGLIIAGYCVAAVIQLLLGRDLRAARLLVSEGVLWGLSFKTAGTLLKLTFIHTWQQIFFFAIILSLRTLVKYIFTWERERTLQARRPHPPARFPAQLERGRTIGY